MKKGTSVLAAVALCVLAGGAGAQSYPAKPVKIMVGFAAGGPTDVIARIVAQDMTGSLGQSFVVENRPGANAIIATERRWRGPRRMAIRCFSPRSRSW